MALEQLRPNARQALDFLFDDLDEAEKCAHDDPVSTKKLIRKIRDRLIDDIRPMLARAPDQNAKLTMEARIAALEAIVDTLRKEG